MKNAVFLGIKGGVLALDRVTGQERWSRKLKGGDFVNVLVDGDRVFASTKGEVFCLDVESGAVIWTNPLPGHGLGFVSIATAAGNTAASLAEQKRVQDTAAVVAASSAAH